MKVKDLMTTDVLTVRTATTLKEAAALLAEHRISGLPVVDGGHVVGVVSEGDILFKESGPPDRPVSSTGCSCCRRRARGKARGQDGRRGDVGAGVDDRPRRPVTEAAR